MNQMTLTVEQVRGVILASAKSDTHYYLCGSLFDFENGRVVSTDGTVLLAVNVDSECSDVAYGSIIVKRSDLEAIAKAGKVTDMLTVSYGADGLTIARENGLSINAEPIDARFPDYARVCPEKTSGEAAQFDPDLLARISKALRLAIDPPKNKPVTVGHNGPKSAYVFCHGYSDRGIAVIMPWKAEGSADAEVLDFWNKGEQESVAA